jgi:gamma-glutamylcyclotransferase (GGCT)/AIG2-like uncharacterized protein YtfP
MTIYAAYGSNLNHGQMSVRCPKAIFLGTARLRNHRLVFRGVADIEPAIGCSVPLGLWHITKDCLMALDRYEGYPHLYGRRDFQVDADDMDVTAMIYFMNAQGYSAPSYSYHQSIADGYRDCGLKIEELRVAVRTTHRFWEKQEAEQYWGKHLENNYESY